MDNNGSECSIHLENLEIIPRIACHNITECEIEWPCELREYWLDLYPFTQVTRCFNSYGTILTCILGIFFNSLSFYILISSGLAKKGSGVYLLTLAICDNCNLLCNYAVGVARGESEEFNQYFMDNVWLCRFHSVSVDVFQLISAWIVVSFTIERCIAIYRPMLLRMAKRYRSKVIVISVTICLTLFSLSKIFVSGFEKDSVFGYIPCDSNALIWPGMAYVRVAFQTWIPTILVFIFNCLLFWKLRRIRNNRKRLTAYRHESIERQRRDLHLQQHPSFFLRPGSTTPMLIAVSLAYLVLVFPIGVVQTIELYWKLKHDPDQFPTHEPQRSEYIKWMKVKFFLKNLRSFFFGLYQCNFAINFFLYCAAGLQFRVHLKYKFTQLCEFLKLHNCACGYNNNNNDESHDRSNNISSISMRRNNQCPINRNHKTQGTNNTQSIENSSSL